MSKREFLRGEVLNLLDDKLKSFGYKLIKSDSSFIQKNSFGWNKFTITFLVSENGWTIRPGLLIRFDIVENLFHQVSNFEKKYQKGTPTLGVAIENLDTFGFNTRFDLNDTNQINSIVRELFELFKIVAIPFFAKFNKLSEVDSQLNKNIEDTSLTGDIFKGTKSLIIASLLKRNNLKELEKAYQSYYENFADGFYLPEYIKLKELLQTDA